MLIKVLSRKQNEGFCLELGDTCICNVINISDAYMHVYNFTHRCEGGSLKTRFHHWAQWDMGAKFAKPYVLSSIPCPVEQVVTLSHRAHFKIMM